MCSCEHFLAVKLTLEVPSPFPWEAVAINSWRPGSELNHFVQWMSGYVPQLFQVLSVQRQPLPGDSTIVYEELHKDVSSEAPILVALSLGSFLGSHSSLTVGRQYVLRSLAPHWGGVCLRICRSSHAVISLLCLLS